jgi:hypothetical protein
VKAPVLVLVLEMVPVRARVSETMAPVLAGEHML